MFTNHSDNTLFSLPRQFNQNISNKERKESPITYGLLDTGLQHCKLVFSIGQVGYFVGYNVAAAVGMAGGAASGAFKYLKTFPSSNRTKSLRQYCIDGAINVNSSSFLKNTATIVGVLVSSFQVVAMTPTFLMFNLSVLIYSALRTCLVAYEFAKREGKSGISKATDNLWEKFNLITLNQQLHCFINNAADREYTKAEINESVAELLSSVQAIGVAYSEAILNMINEVPRLAKKVLPESVVKRLEGQNVKSGRRFGNTELSNRSTWQVFQTDAFSHTGTTF